MALLALSSQSDLPDPLALQRSNPLPLDLADLSDLLLRLILLDPLVQVNLENLGFPLSLADLSDLLHQQPLIAPILRLATYCLVPAHLHKFVDRRRLHIARFHPDPTQRHLDYNVQVAKDHERLVPLDLSVLLDL